MHTFVNLGSKVCIVCTEKKNYLRYLLGRKGDGNR